MSTISTLCRYLMPDLSLCSATKRNWRESRSIVQEESYNSKASFLDLDLLPAYDKEREADPVFSGKRVERGLYRARNGRRIHADVNGSYNIGRKAFPNSFGQGIEAALAVRPVGLPMSLVIPSWARERAAVLQTRA